MQCPIISRYNHDSEKKYGDISWYKIFGDTHPYLLILHFQLFDIQLFKCALGISPVFCFIWTQVLNHNKYVETKQFSKVDIKQNNISILNF